MDKHNLQQPAGFRSPSTAQPSNVAKAVLSASKTVTKPQQKNTSRSSKPFINWFQRKLSGPNRLKRAENRRLAGDNIALGKGRAGSSSSRAVPRIASSPLPSPAARHHFKQEFLGTVTQRKTISLNDNNEDFSADDGDDNSLDQSSFARESTWSPGSALEADEDASVRPIPPSAPPSPSPSRSSSSYLSDPRTFRSIAASTKPTTLLSIDMNGNGMAHIAQAPTTPTTLANRFSPVRNSSSTTTTNYGNGNAVTFSSFPQSSSRPSSLSNPGALSDLAQGVTSVTVLQAPLHTTHHPRNNPRPSSPPLDNASVLTLASSAYAVPGLRLNLGHSTTPSAKGVGDSLSHLGGSIIYADAESTSQFVLGDDERLDERDVDASVRALRPRSSRRGSWESEASGWSARVQAVAGTPSLVRERSLRTTNSTKAGALSSVEQDVYEEPNNPEDEGENIEPPVARHIPTIVNVSSTSPGTTLNDKSSELSPEHKMSDEPPEPPISISKFSDSPTVPLANIQVRPEQREGVEGTDPS